MFNEAAHGDESGKNVIAEEESLGREIAKKGSEIISRLKEFFGIKGAVNPSFKLNVAGKTAGAVTSAGISVLNTDVAGAGIVLLEKKWFSTCEAAGRCSFVEDYGTVPSVKNDFSGAIEFYESRGHFEVMRNRNGEIVDYRMIPY